MPHLAQYVYQDYHIRIDALRAKVSHPYLLKQLAHYSTSADGWS
jgi:hypothetical protein